MHRGVQWPEPTLQWPDGKLIACTFRVAYEAFRKSGRFKKSSKIDINVTSLSHANYGGAVGIWRLMDMFDRHDISATIGANGLAVEKWPETIKAMHAAGHEIASHGMTNDHHMTDLTPDEQRQEARDCIARDRGLHRRAPGRLGRTGQSAHRARRSGSLRTKAIAGSATPSTTTCPMSRRSTASASR